MRRLLRLYFYRFLGYNPIVNSAGEEEEMRIRPAAQPMEEIRAENARTDAVITVVAVIVSLLIILVLVAGAVQCSPLLREEICTDGVLREGLRVLFGL